ncbi:hypothetical protein BGW37DRAFT_494858 [Umbelopsis sp. PMI_123]|nr:hypothetical protein BGW37DRAFT_494858 [Umbelopsis sp. PMI_123]
MFLPYLALLSVALFVLAATAAPTNSTVPHRQYAQFHSLKKRDDLLPSQLPAGLATVPLPNNMEVTVLFTQFPTYVTYTVTLFPNGIPLPADGSLCLSWAVGLPGLYIDSTHQCNFPSSQTCLSGVPINPCATSYSLNLTNSCNPVEYLSGSMNLAGATYSVPTPLVSINSTNLQVSSGASNSIAGKSVLISYSHYKNGTGSAIEQDLRCADVYLGNGTANNFTYSNTNGQTGPSNGTITITTNNTSHLLLDMSYLISAVLASLLLLLFSA